MRLFKLKLPKDFEYLVDADADGSVKISVTFALHNLFSAKLFAFSDRFAMILMEKKVSQDVQ